jgi:glycerol-3-phosphate dehydrogenase
MPISKAVDALLHHGAAVDPMIDLLMRRPYQVE